MDVSQQRTLQKFVEREVIMPVSQLVEDLLKSSMYDGKTFGKIELDNIENLYIVDEAVAQGYGFESLEAMQEVGEDRREIYEWWFVSPWLYERLREVDEPVIDSDFGYLWGRTCTGQAIFLDSVIEKIYNDSLRL